MKTNKERLLGSFPQTPLRVSYAVQRALGQVHQEVQPEPPKRYARRLSFGTVALIVLLLATIAVAATLLSHNVFDLTLGATPQSATSMIQRDLAKQSFGECDVEVKEAAYDGMSLYIVYSIRDRNATQPLGDAGDDGVRYVSSDRMEAMERDDIGWWTDHLWIDGKCVDMPNMSSGVTIGSETPGELLYYVLYRLDQSNVVLDGKSVEIALPIGKRQTELVKSAFNGSFEKPKDGLVTFRMDCSVRDGVTTAQPNITLELPAFSAKVSEVVYTPIQLYVTVQTHEEQAAMDAYIAEHGEGYYDAEGKLISAYTELDLTADWAANLLLVDKNGKPVLDAMEGMYGYQGMDGEHVWYTFPSMEKYPEEMYLAPLSQDGETCAMTEAVRVK